MIKSKRSFHGTARRVSSIALAGIFTLVGTNTADAQGRGRGNQDRGRSSQGIPPGHLPPPGECRVWYDNRPPGQQPPPTSCSNARVTAARSVGRVIYGDDRDRRRDDDRCDDRDRRNGECRIDRRDDRDRDRYPGRTYPGTLPEMIWGLSGGQGEYRNQVRQWVGADPVRVHFTDADRNRTPEIVTWTDTAGRILQRWYDDNRDGRADRVALYQDNRVVRVIR